MRGSNIGTEPEKMQQESTTFTDNAKYENRVDREYGKVRELKYQELGTCAGARDMMAKGKEEGTRQ